jgi:hypothetical protein
MMSAGATSSSTSGRARLVPVALGVAGALLAAGALLMAGRTILSAQAPRGAGPADTVLVKNLVDDVLAGRASVNSPSGSVLGPDRFVDVRYLSVQAQDRPLRDAGASTRRWLFTHPPTEIGDDLVLPPDAYFQTGLALDPSIWDAPLGDGVRYVVTVTPQGGQPITVLDAAVNPRADGNQRRWIDVVADLRPWAGQTVRLTLHTDGRQEPSFDWAGWSEPSVVKLDALTAARLLDSTAGIKALALRS